MKKLRSYITPFISLVFLVVGTSGVFMFFHVFDGYTEVVHELLGVFFVICAVFHIMLNWKPLRMHFTKGVFVPAALAVALVSATIVVGQIFNPKVDTIVIARITQAPIEDAFRALQVEVREASKRLEAKGITMEGAATIEEIWINNGADPEEVIDLITGH